MHRTELLAYLLMLGYQRTPRQPQASHYRNGRVSLVVGLHSCSIFTPGHKYRNVSFKDTATILKESACTA